MPIYQYKARNLKGEIQKGDLEASGREAAVLQLRNASMIPLEIMEKGSGGGGIEMKGLDFSFGSNKVKPKDLQIFTRQLSVLINAGVPLMESLDTIKDILFNPYFREVVEDILSRIQRGANFSTALGAHPNVFDHIYVNLVKAGEEGGVLDQILDRLAKFIETSVAIKGKVKGAMTYPIAIIVISMLILSGMLIFVVPKMADIFSGSGKELPGLTQFVINMSDFLKAYWYLILPSPIAIFYGLKVAWKNPQLAPTLDKVVLALPVFGDLVRRSTIAQSARTLETLITSGVPLVQALDVVIPTVGNSVLGDVFSAAKSNVVKGGKLSSAFKRSQDIPNMVASMISIGEESGNVDLLLRKCADFYEQEVEVSVEAMLKLIEPMLIVVLGGIVGFIIAAMYLPIFQMAQNIGG